MPFKNQSKLCSGLIAARFSQKGGKSGSTDAAALLAMKATSNFVRHQEEG